MERKENSADLVTPPLPVGAVGSFPNPPSSAAPAVRFVFVDGLRGLAALGIALYHIWRYEPLPYPSLEFVPSIVDWLLLRTWIGVQFLLVVSGFVIAFTLRNTWVTPREAVSFIGRRAVRLWPPYAVTILIVVLSYAACVNWWNLPPQFNEPLTMVRVMAHLAFLQDILGETPLSAGIWTVCIEMQFYGVCVLGWWLAQRLLPLLNPQRPRPSTSGLLLVFAPLALVSLIYWNPQESTEPWVTHFLCSFFLGMVTWWTLDRKVPLFVFATTMVIVASVAGYRFVFDGKIDNAISLTAALAIFVAGRTGHLGDWLNWRWLQYLGRISYSLYLIHDPVSHLVTQFGWKLCGNSPTPAQASLILFLCLIASIAAGHLMHECVEAPSNRCAAWLKSRRPE